MICQATYDSLEAIPQNLRDEFEQVNGKWQIKADAVPGIGPLFNAALSANSERQLGQLATKREELRIAKEELNKAQDKLAVLDTPGNKILSKADADTFDAYTTLGTPKEIKEKLANYDDLSGKVTRFETTDTLRKVTEANGLGDVKLNPEVLSDWLTSEDGKGHTVFIKTAESTDAKGAKVNVEVPFVRIEKTVDGKQQVSERELLPFAKEVLPEWKYSALVSGATVAPADKGKGKQPANGAGGGVKIPDLGSARKQADDTGSEKKRPIDIFNEQRAAKPNPFAPLNTASLLPMGAAPITRDK